MAFETHGRSLRGLSPLTCGLLFCSGIAAAPFFSFFALKAGGLAIGLGPLSYHMSSHIWLMNVLAPLLVLSLISFVWPHVPYGAKGLGAATTIQIMALWTVHIPVVLNLAMASHAVHFAFQAILFAAALYFWWTVMAQRLDHSWRSLFALLITGKLFCLLGVLLVFAPRHLYPALADGHANASHGAVDVMADQQLAGLLMLIACPLSYVLAGTIIAARWLRGLAARELDAAGRHVMQRNALAR